MIDDPVFLKSVIGKSAQITTIKDSSHCGVIYVVDPISKTIILANIKPTSKYNLEIIPYTSIKSFEITSSSIISPHFVIKNDNIDNKDFEEDKMKVLKWLAKNRINVVDEDGTLKLTDHMLTIESPYKADHCFCDNAIVLDRIRSLIINMPP